MGSILNGMNLHGGLRVYGGTFLVFSDYVRPAVRLAALMHAPSIFVFSHDSIGLGEDGPTHQPVEHNAALRAIPNLLFFRPADAHETVASWYTMLRQKNPSAIALTRQDLPVLDLEKHNVHEGVARGAYVLSDAGDPQVLLLGTGSEVHIAVEAQQLLADAGIGSRVVSMPCWELFEAQSDAYKNEVLPPDIKARVSVEAGVTFGWKRYVGDHGISVGLDHFGASAPFETLYTEFGITAQAVSDAARRSLANAQK
jgi:transketolase